MARKPTGRPTGRPKRVIDWQKFEFGCQINATKEEISKWLNVSEDTLERMIKVQYGETFAVVYKKLSVDGISACPPIDYPYSMLVTVTLWMAVVPLAAVGHKWG